MTTSSICIVDPTQGNSTSRIMGFLSSISNFCSQSKLASVIGDGVKVFNLAVEKDCVIDDNRAAELADETSLCSWSAHDRGATFSGACSTLHSNLNDTIIKSIKNQCPANFNWLAFYIVLGIIGGAVVLPLAFCGIRNARNRFHNNGNDRPDENGDGPGGQKVPLLNMR